MTESVSSQVVGDKQPSPAAESAMPRGERPTVIVLTDRVSYGIEHPHIFALLAEHIEPRAIG